MEDIRMGFRPDPQQNVPAENDFRRLSLDMPTITKGSVDLRPFSVERHDQKYTESCVAQAIVKALEIKRVMKFGPQAHLNLSRLALYYLARELMDPPETNQDKGTYVRLAAEVLKRFGVCRENKIGDNDRYYWPFDIGDGVVSTGKLHISPGWLAMREAYTHKISDWYKITTKGEQRVADCIQALRNGNTVVFGGEYDTSFRFYDGSLVTVPNQFKLGWHAVCLVGWDDEQRFFWAENSWGSGWGPYGGFFRIDPYFIASDSTLDFVVIQSGYENYQYPTKWTK